MSAEYLQQELDSENRFLENEIAEDEKMPTKEEVGYVAKAERYTYCSWLRPSVFRELPQSRM